MPNPRAPKPLTLEQVKNDLQSSRKSPTGGAAFGITPMIGKRREDRQDREAAKSFPVDLARGVAAGFFGMPADFLNLPGDVYSAVTDNELYKVPYGSEDILKRLPFGTETPAGQFASGLGSIAGGSANVGSVIRGVKAAPGALKTAARNLSAPRTLNPEAGVIKMKGGNWLGGRLMGNMDENIKRLKPIKDVDKRLEAAEAQLASMINAGGYGENTLKAQQDVIDIYRQQQAVNNWVTSNLGKYVKNQMATPEDPIRLLLDKRTKEIEAKHAKDLQRAERVAQRAMDEPDPRRQANMIRESERLKMEANVERQFAMDSIIPSRMQDYSPEADYYLKQRRQEAGFPAEGMGESEAAKRYETLTDDAISTMRAGDVQETKKILAQAQDAERAFKTKQLEVAKRFDEHIRNSDLSEDQIRVLNEKTPIADKADMIQDREYGELGYAYNKLRTDIRRDEFAAGQENPFIDKLDPETQLYSGNTADMGFDHVIDILRQDVASGRIRPEQLNKVSVEDAVRRTMEFDQEAARKMAEAQIKATEGFPTYKEYPEGYKWIELKAPEISENILSKLTPSEREYYDRYLQSGDTPMDALLAAAGDKNPAYKALEDALKYEGDTMGHCVGGYCPDVVSGKSRIFSLRDAKGEPHVTVEVGPVQGRTSYDDMQAIYNQAQEEANAKNFATTGEFNNFYNDRVKELQFALIDKQKAELPERIVQIKGKQNAAPKAEYLPYVQDFVKSGTYSDVGDLQNTGLFKLGNDYMTEAEAATKYKPMTQEALNFLETHPAFEQHRAADKAYSGFKGDPLTPEYREVERAAGTPVSPNVPYTYRELRALLSSPEDWTDRNGTIYDPISKAIEKLNEAKKELGLDLPPPEGMAGGGSVHFSDNPDVMMLELAGGGLIKKGIKAAAKAVKGTQDVLPAAEREENLQKFLGNSRIRERMYHATPKDFKAFKPGGDDPTLSGPAIWVTPDATKQPAAHNIGGGSRGFVEGTNVMPVYVQARSPLMLDDRLSIEWAREVFADGSREFPDLISQKTIDELKSSGYDSIIHADPYGNRGGEQEIIMFEPNKIKSAIGNRGTYDIEDPDITKAAGGAVRMQAGGPVGLLGMGIKAASKALKGTQDVLPAAEREANKAKFLEGSKTPMRLYHGTTATEGGKRQEAIRRIKPSKEGALGSGVYLTPNSAHASGYSGIPNDEAIAAMAGDPYAKRMADQFMADRASGTLREGQEGGNMLPVTARLRNPLIIEGKGDPMVEALTKLGMDEDSASKMVERAYEQKGYIGKQVQQRAQAAGYDGLMQYRDGELSEVVSYNPNAVKSDIGNRGTYDMNDPDLNKAKGGRVRFSNNPDVMMLELARGGAVRMQSGGSPSKRAIGAGAKAIRALKDAFAPKGVDPIVVRTPEERAVIEKFGQKQEQEAVRQKKVEKAAKESAGQSPEAQAAKPAKSTGKRVAVPPDVYRKMAEEQGDEAVLKAARAGKHLKPTAEGYIGAPRTVTSGQGLGAMRRAMDTDFADSVEAVRLADPERLGTWYDRAKQGIAESSEPYQLPRTLEQHGVYSAGVSPESELTFALKHLNSRAAGNPQMAYRGAGMRNLDEAVAENRPANMGFKIGEYANKNDPRIPNEGLFGVNDFRRAQGMGYTDPQGNPWKAGVSDTMHPFMDAETALQVDRANTAGTGGRTDWQGPHIQEVPWVYGKAQDLYSRGKQGQYKGDELEGIKMSLQDANNTARDYMYKHTASATHEAIPGAGLNHVPQALDMTPEEKLAYGQTGRWDLPSPEAALNEFPEVGAGNRDILYGAAGYRQLPSREAEGLYVNSLGGVENNPMTIARPLMDFPTGGGGLMAPDSRATMDFIEHFRPFMDAQEAGAYNLPNTMNAVQGKNSMLLDTRGLSSDPLADPTAGVLPTAKQLGEINSALSEASGAAKKEAKELREKLPFGPPTKANVNKLQGLEDAASGYGVTSTNRGALVFPYNAEASSAGIKDLMKRAGPAIENVFPGAKQERSLSTMGYQPGIGKRSPEGPLPTAPFSGEATADLLRHASELPQSVLENLSESEWIRNQIREKALRDAKMGGTRKDIQESRRFFSEADWPKAVAMIRKGMTPAAALAALGYNINAMAAEEQ